MASTILTPSGYTSNSNINISTSSNAISNAYADTSSTTYAQLTPSSTSTTGYIYLTFDTSAIPANATITSVTAQAKLRINNTNRVTQCSV
jgi:Tfp pilus assembly protein PilE